MENMRKIEGKLCNLNCSSKCGWNLECILTLSFFRVCDIRYIMVICVTPLKRVFQNAEMIQYERNEHCILIIMSSDPILIILISILYFGSESGKEKTS